MKSPEFSNLLQVPDLATQTMELLRQIPAGRVSTYGDLARALGDDELRSARWVGELMRSHPHDATCVCHRVVRQTGVAGLYCLPDEQLKQRRLAREGVDFDERGRIDLSRFRFTDFVSMRPLLQLTRQQDQWAGMARLEPFDAVVHSALGLDVAYAGRDIAVGAAVLIDAETLEPIRQWTCAMPVTFPYVPGFLAFRELPMLLQLWQQVLDSRECPDVVFVDGNGRLHPRRAGIATSFGVLADVPTIGIGKSLLCGGFARTELSPDAPQPVVHHDELIGYAVQNKRTSRPIYLSPGHRISAEDALRIACRMFAGHRVPEPIHLADRLTKQMAHK